MLSHRKTRDGTSRNIHTGTDFNDIDSYGVRFSLDADIGDDSTLQFTYEMYESDDNRSNVGTSLCEPHPVLGCNPLTRGTLNAPPDSRGSTAALFNLIGALNNTADKNYYDGAIIPVGFRTANVNRIPIHKQVAEMSTLQFDTQLNDYLSLTAKYSYATRDYQHMNDNDYSVSVRSIPRTYSFTTNSNVLDWLFW